MLLVYINLILQDKYIHVHFLAVNWHLLNSEINTYKWHYNNVNIFFMLVSHQPDSSFLQS